MGVNALTIGDNSMIKWLIDVRRRFECVEVVG
jgi:hypothetical protein